MGLYDTIEVGDKSGQVKCFITDMRTYTPGDIMPECNGYTTYSIAMREGGFINVTSSVLMSWTDEPEHKDVFDKWGDNYDPDNFIGIGVKMPGETYHNKGIDDSS